MKNLISYTAILGLVLACSGDKEEASSSPSEPTTVTPVTPSSPGSSTDNTSVKGSDAVTDTSSLDSDVQVMCGCAKSTAAKSDQEFAEGMMECMKISMKLQQKYMNDMEQSIKGQEMAAACIGESTAESIEKKLKDPNIQSLLTKLEEAEFKDELKKLEAKIPTDVDEAELQKLDKELTDELEKLDAELKKIAEASGSDLQKELEAELKKLDVDLDAELDAELDKLQEELDVELKKFEQEMDAELKKLEAELEGL